MGRAPPVSAFLGVARPPERVGRPRPLW